MLKIYEPKLEELWFREKLLSDEETMKFNHHWGETISFPRDIWDDWYDYWLINHDNKRYYRYLVNVNSDFIGEIAYHYDDELDGYIANIIIHASFRHQGYGKLGLMMLCDAAKNSGIKTLYDDIAIDNPSLSLFIKLGFVEERRTEEKIILKKEL